MKADRILVRLPNWLGDIVMALPALAMVRAGFPGAHLTFALPAAFAPIFAERTDAAPDAVLALKEKDQGRRSEIAKLRSVHADLAILLTNSFGSAWIVRRARIRERWGYRANLRRALLTRAVRRPGGRVHQAEYYRALMTGLDLPKAESIGRMVATAQTRARGRALLERAGMREGTPIVGFAPGAAYGQAKRWPPQRAGEVARQLSERGIAVVLVGAAADRDAGRAIESVAPVVNLIGRTSLSELIGVIAACETFLSNDSGAMHLAAAIGRPVVAIFGPTNELATAPEGEHDVLTADVFCRPCMLRDCPIDHRCMKRISAERVVETILHRLNLSTSLRTSS
jgi:lipopolysaccharide heptosyltransferase II